MIPSVHESIQVEADPTRVLDTLRASLLGNGLLVRQVSAFELHAVGRWRGTRRSALLAITSGTFRVEWNRLSVRAELGGVPFARKFLILFPLGLGLVLTAVLFLALKFAQDGKEPVWTALLAPLLAVLPWLALGPLVARKVEIAARRAIKELLESLTSMR